MKLKFKMKPVPKYFITLVIAAIVGGALGFASQVFDTSIAWALIQLKGLLLETSPYALLVINLVFLGTSLAFYKKSLNTYSGTEETRDEDNENIYKQIDIDLSYAMGCTALSIICNVIWLCFLVVAGNNHYISIAEELVGLGFFLVFSVGFTMLQRVYVNFTKKINPEKKGEPLDRHFHKDWINSCDEQERTATYKAAYKAYSYSNLLYSGIFIVLILSSMLIVDIGIAPFLVLGVIWFTQTAIYLRACIKESK